MATQVLAERDENVLVLSLQMNDQNAFTLEGFGALRDALRDAEKDDSVRAMVLRSNASGFFSNGLDPNGIHGKSKEDIIPITDLFFEVLDLTLFFPAPIVAEIGGHCMGYGAMLSIFSDYRFMLERGARISFPEVQLGIGIPVTVTRVLQDIVGRNAARDLAMSGKAIKGPDALALGLVDGLYSAEELPAAAMREAKRLAGGSRYALRGIKESLRYPYLKDRDEVLKYDLEKTRALLTSPDAKEGFASLVEKRRPRFE